MKTVQALANDGFEERASRVVFHQVVPFVGAAEGLSGEHVTIHHDQQARIGRESIGSPPLPHGGSRVTFGALWRRSVIARWRIELSPRDSRAATASRDRPWVARQAARPGDGPRAMTACPIGRFWQVHRFRGSPPDRAHCSRVRQLAAQALRRRHRVSTKGLDQIDGRSHLES